MEQAISKEKCTLGQMIKVKIDTIYPALTTKGTIQTKLREEINTEMETKRESKSTK